LPLLKFQPSYNASSPDNQFRLFEGTQYLCFQGSSGCRRNVHSLGSGGRWGHISVIQPLSRWRVLFRKAGRNLCGQCKRPEDCHMLSQVLTGPLTHCGGFSRLVRC